MNASYSYLMKKSHLNITNNQTILLISEILLEAMFLVMAANLHILHMLMCYPDLNKIYFITIVDYEDTLFEKSGLIGF